MQRNNNMATTHDDDGPPQTVRLLTLNCWGLLYISTLRRERLREIGRRIGALSPAPDVVCLQECWVQSDYEAIRAATREVLPHGKLFRSGVWGSGLAVLSRWAVEEADMHPYRLNGRPTAFWRGDWYVGKGVAWVTVRVGRRAEDVVHILNTHTHAPYEKDARDSYACHRAAQLWDMACLLRRATAHPPHLVVALGDFNMLPLSLPHRILTGRAPVCDAWRVVHPNSSLGPASKTRHLVAGGDGDSLARENNSAAVINADGTPGINTNGIPSINADGTMNADGIPSSMNADGTINAVPSAAYNLSVNGATSDGLYNTWRWTKNRQNRLRAGSPCPVDPEAPDYRGKRLDYVFFCPRSADEACGWVVDEVAVALTERHPELRVSLSDHFAVSTTLKLHRLVGSPSDVNSNSEPASTKPASNPSSPSPHDTQLATSLAAANSHLATTDFSRLLALTRVYTHRESRQRRLRALHFYASLVIWAACLVALCFSPRFFVALILAFVGSLVLASGLIDGLLALLFFSAELRCLEDFEAEVRSAAQDAVPSSRRASPDWDEVDGPLRQGDKASPSPSAASSPSQPP